MTQMSGAAVVSEPRSVAECRAAIARLYARQLPDREAEIWDALRPAERSVWVRMCGGADWVEREGHMGGWREQPEDLRQALLEKFLKWADRAAAIRQALKARAAS